MAERKAVTIYVGDAKSLVAASAEAKAAIKGVQDQANKKSGLDKMPKLGGAITTSLLALSPVITGLTGALGGLAASATAAAGGAGAVGVGGLGALVVGLGSVAAVVKPAAASFKTVTTALDAYNLTMAQNAQAQKAAQTALDTTGKHTKQHAAAQAALTASTKAATTAQQKLNAVVGQNGGADVLKAAKSWDALGSSFQKLTAPATSSLFKTFNDGLSTMKALLPTVAGIANKSMAALSEALQAPLSMLKSSEFQGILKSLGNTFAQSIGPAIQAASLTFLAFSRIAQAAGPYVVQLSIAIENMASKFALATADPKRLSTIIAALVSQTKSWIALGGALIKLIFDVFKQGAVSGQEIVTSLTTIVGKWDAWVTSAKGSSDITRFFQQSATFTKDFGTALLPILKAFSVMSTGALPIYISLMSKLKGIMGPLTYAFVAYKVALIAATAATKAAEAIGSVKKLFGGGVATAGTGAAVAGGAGGTAARTAAGASSVEAAAAGAAATGASIGLGTIAIGAAAAYVGISALSKAINGDGGINAGLTKMRTEMSAAINSGDTAKLQQLSQQSEALGSKLSSLGVGGAGAYKTLGEEAQKAATKITQSSAAMNHGLGLVAPIFKIMAGDAGLSLGKILTQAKSAGSAIASTLGTKSTDARVALATNFNIAAQDVRSSMQAGVVNTGQGMKAIAQLVNKALSALGGKPLAVSNFLADVGPGVVTAQQLVSAGDLSQGGVNSVHAGGGFIGNQGEKGRDNVPIVVGRGEAILNHTQQRVVNGALAAVGIGGLPSLFSGVTTPHYMASGGMAGTHVTAPKVSGHGDMAAIVRAAVGTDAAAANALITKTLGAAGGSGSPSGAMGAVPPGTVRNWLTQALKLTNHFSPANLAALYSRTIQESGGNPHAINLWDSNAKAGHPSKGLLQTIDSTFSHYMLPGMGDIWNPIDNAVAAIRYMFAGYGHIVGASGSGYAKGGFVGSFKNGGVIPETGMALVHKGETVIPAFASGGLVKGTSTNNILTSAAAFLYPLDEALAELSVQIGNLQNSTAANHNREIAGLNAQINTIKREKINPPQAHNAGQITALQGQLSDIRTQSANAPSGKKGNAERKQLAAETLAIEQKIRDLKAQDSSDISKRRKDLANQTLTIEEKIKKLKADDSAAKASLADQIKDLTVQQTNLTQLKNYKDAITSLKTQVDGLAQQAAQAWNAIQSGKISATHDAAIAAINGGADATTLAAMQSQDTANANAAQLASLQATLASDTTLANNSGGQTHLTALAQVKTDQAAIDAFNRQQTENQLQDNINAATKAADDAQTIAMNGLAQQTTDYQTSLDAQLQALTQNLNARKLTYAQWAADVNAILLPYGLSAGTDPTTEGTVAAGPGPAGGTLKVKVTGGAGGFGVAHKPAFGGGRASGGAVRPGYVYRVGEQGPEDVVFGQRGTVMTAAQTRRGGGHTVNIEKAYFTGAQAAKATVDRLAFRAAIGTA